MLKLKSLNALMVFSLTSSLVLSLQARAESFEEFFEQFHKNPAEVMNRLPVKEGAPSPERGLPADSVFEAKTQAREKILRNGQGLNTEGLDAEAAMNDRIEHLTDVKKSSIVRKLSKMSSSAKLSESPWSDDYWPIYKGQTAWRWADPATPSAGGFEDYVESVFPGSGATLKSGSVDKMMLDMILGNQVRSSSIETLSPAEKYDLLVGDTARSLTRSQYTAGVEYFRDSGKVETWMGLCHGWAPAAYMSKRPKNAIKVKTTTASGQVVEIPFYPSDIKALTTLLWATSAPDARFIGGRCNTKAPSTDANGRTIDRGCFDTNPGTWHLAVVNQISKAKRSFVMDATFDYEVWNHPVYAYEYSLFNPETGAETSSVDSAKAAIRASDATRRIPQFGKDKFASYRSAEAKYVVGVKMKVDYVVETRPNRNTRDSSRHDAIQSATYIYDLELNSKDEIIGGEWYSNAHPDFLWTFPKEARALSVVDERAKGITGLVGSYANYSRDNWNSRSNDLPASWKAVAPEASTQGQPLTKVVETLVTLSNSGI